MAIRLLNAVTTTGSAPALAFATGTITAVAGANLVDGETFTIKNQRGISVTFEFDSNSSVTAGRVAVAFTGADTSTTVATAIAAAISGVASLGISAVGSVATVTCTARLSGPDWNAGVTETVANGGFAVTDITGGSWAGFPLNGEQPGYAPGYWEKAWDAGMIEVTGAGTGALTFQGIIWLYDVKADAWSQAGVSSTPGNRGMLNDGTTITGTSTLAHMQPVSGLSGASRIYLQSTTQTAGAGNQTVSAYLTQRFV